MQCESCNHDNVPSARFCISCGAALGRTCSSCNHRNPPAARFCAQCGAGLTEAPAPPAAPVQAELKQITVFFADIAGSTQLIESLNPEEAVKRLAPGIAAMEEAVRRFEGSVVRVQGDGIMAVFGTPNPQEDHAVRACCAGLALQDAIRALPGAPLTIRAGIHSGEVLARTIATSFSTDFDAGGVTVHVASRLESLAPPNGIVVSPSTLRAARQFISVESLGRKEIRGLSVPMEIFQLTGLRRGAMSQRFSSESTRTRFLGRDREIELLKRALERASDGDGCAVGIVADAGVGKSRLCFEFAEHCRTQGVRVLEARALAHSRATPFEPVIDVVKAVFEISADDTPAEARDKIADLCSRLDPELSADLPLIADFLGLADGAGAREKIDPATRRERLNGFFRRLMRSASRDQSLVLLVEDLHFLDTGSESILEVLADSLVGTRLLLLVNFRPGFAASWMRIENYEQISLPPLNQAAAGELVHGLLGDDPSVAPLVPLIGDRARGNPFFIEELVRKFDESGHLAGSLGDYRLLRAPDMKLIPDNVQAIVSARIDSRPELERSLLQTAAVIGREFGAAVLEHVAGVAGDAVRAVLHRLSAAGLVYETGGGTMGGFAFRHPMVQEVTYRSLTSDRRRALHAAVAADLEKSLPDPNGAQAGFVAYHFEEAGNGPMAASYNMKAAMWHGTRDPAQALEAWRRVRRLLSALPLEGPARYPLLMATGQIVNLAWREGLAATDVETYYKEALAIAVSLGDMRAVTLVTAAYGRALASTGLATDYVDTVTQAMERLDPARHAGLRVLLSAIRCHARWLAGDLRGALADNDVALAQVDKVEAQDEQTLGFRVATWVKGMRSKVLAMSDRCDEARLLAEEMIAADEATVDTLHRILAHGTMVDIAWGRRDAELARVHGAIAQALGEKSGNPYLNVYGLSFGALGLGLADDYTGAAGLLTEALRFARQRRAGLENEARMLCDLAWVQQRAGLVERARDTAEEAASVARRRGATLALAYAEWLLNGDSAAFRTLVEQSGARLLARHAGVAG
ncbi:MAG: AAA family ATPase [Proteobacteria bacterium]|nr:AAA family ATPase [Pseudomonadota bacterium]